MKNKIIDNVRLFYFYFKYFFFILVIVISIISVVLGYLNCFFWVNEPILIKEPINVYFQLKIQQTVLLREIGIIEARLDILYQHVGLTDLMSNSDLYFSNWFEIWRAETRLNILKESLSIVQNNLNNLLAASRESVVDLTTYVSAISILTVGVIYIISKLL